MRFSAAYHRPSPATECMEQLLQDRQIDLGRQHCGSDMTRRPTQGNSPQKVIRDHHLVRSNSRPRSGFSFDPPSPN